MIFGSRDPSKAKAAAAGASSSAEAGGFDNAEFGDVVLCAKVLQRLLERQLIKGDTAGARKVRLTERGRRLRESTRTMRQKVRHREVVSESDYATTIRVLQRLVENLRAGEDL